MPGAPPPVGPARIDDGPDDHRLLLVGQGQHLGDQARAVLLVVAEHAGDEAGAEPCLLLVGEETVLLHGVHRGFIRVKGEAPVALVWSLPALGGAGAVA